MEVKCCANCKKTWRHVDSIRYCNACAVYLGNHGMHRPQRLFQQALARQASTTQGSSRTPKRQRTLEPQEVCACDPAQQSLCKMPVHGLQVVYSNQIPSKLCPSE